MKNEFFFKSRSIPIEARSSRNSTACYEKHTHEEFSLGIIETGQAEFFLAGKIMRITPGSVVVINPDMVHSCNPVAASWSYKMLYICPKWLRSVLKEGGQVDLDAFYSVNIAHSKAVSAYQGFQELFSENVEGNNDVKIIKQLIINIVDELMSCTKTADKYEGCKPAKDELLLARDYIIEHCAEPLSIAGISELVGLSQYHLIRSFRQRFGLTPHAFQLAQRVCRGRKMLADGMGISAVAINTGFSDQSHFHRNFKKMVAVTPKRYKNDTQY